eukprot:jgi/Botrbrau1/17732/Bobra.0166s0152.2
MVSSRLVIGECCTPYHAVLNIRRCPGVPAVVPSNFPCSSSNLRKMGQKSFTEPWPIRASLESDFTAGQNGDIDDGGPVLVPLNPDSQEGLGGTSEGLFGPLACLLIGFLHSEVDIFRAFMNEMEADIVKVISCSNKMLEWRLGDALEAPVPPYEQLKLGTPRAVILSGMYAAEVLEVISCYKDSGLPATMWAGAVPGNWDRKVQTLISDMAKEEKLMKEREQEALEFRLQGMEPP